MTLRHLVLFVRAPQYGVGKRRLAGDVGDLAALRFQRAMLGMLFRRLGRDRRWRLRLAVTPDRALGRARLWPHGVPISAQGKGNLGMRMRRALAACPPGPAVLIGADIPAVAACHIAAAFRLLGDHDLVFGPAADGGFWLVGARRSPRLPPLFGTVRWSGPHALADALGNLPRLVSVGFAARLEDVDDGAALRRHSRKPEGAPTMRREITRRSGARTMLTITDYQAEFAKLRTLQGRTPETPAAAREGAFARLADYRDGGIFAAKFAGESSWERHPNGDEIVQIVEGSTTLHLMTADGPQSYELTAGMMAIVPQGTWHRFVAPDGVGVMTATPQPTEHLTVAVDDPRTLDTAKTA